MGVTSRCGSCKVKVYDIAGASKMELQPLPPPRNVTGTAVTATVGSPTSPEDRLRCSCMPARKWKDVTLVFADALPNEHCQRCLL